MLEAVLEALQLQSDGIYLDATFGRGGHAQAILQVLGPEGRLLAIDRDPEAIQYARQKLADEPRFTIQHGCFDMLAQFCKEQEIAGRLNGILMDLGMSSPQIDNAERGFSFQVDGPLDMRMDNSNGLSAAQWLAEADEKEIADVLWRYGEERNSRRIARHIVQQRQRRPIETTRQLAELIAEASPMRDRHKHPATRCFQAIRIFINRELESLEHALLQTVEVLAQGGRLVVISFHSLEDRIVKRFMREQARGQLLPRGLPVMAGTSGQTLRLLGKAQRPTACEVNDNPRSRSAVLRIAERL
ncbi:MAG: 16S rRNA (cytosine(1402)-N(4))-methyltransferase RsmH [Gammaproteobacteria bacterium]|nr:16S rRNA (cytosine(1402)-N(4))-methyltransferase RsmH [Gammaproteobacteria bacterium]